MSEFLSHLGGAALNSLRGSPLDRIVNHLMGGQSGASGLQALVEKLRGGGLGDRVDSWVSTGPNREIQPAELERALGEPEAERLAHESGMERGGLMAVLSSFLPKLVDGLTPQGRLPTRDDELPQGAGGGGLSGMLSGILDRLGGGGDPQSGQQSGQGLGGLMPGSGAGALHGGAGGDAARHTGLGAGGDAGMPRFGDGMPGSGEAPASGAGGPPIRRT